MAESHVHVGMVSPYHRLCVLCDNACGRYRDPCPYLHPCRSLLLPPGCLFSGRERIENVVFAAGGGCCCEMFKVGTLKYDACAVVPRQVLRAAN